MKKYKAAIFDMDGTLLDTMYIWHNLSREYLRRNNINVPPEMEDKLKAMSIDRAARFLIDNFHLDTAEAEIQKEMLAILEEYYSSNSVLRPGALRLLQELYERKVSTVILSATPKHLLHLALGKADVEKYFTHGLMSCFDIQCTKLQPEAFFHAVKKLQVSADEVVVFEDAWYAANTAKNAGFALALISERNEVRSEEMRAMADFYVENSWDEFPIDSFF